MKRPLRITWEHVTINYAKATLRNVIFNQYKLLHFPEALFKLAKFVTTINERFNLKNCDSYMGETPFYSSFCISYLPQKQGVQIH